MQTFLISITTVGLAEVGDRTQLLSLILAARYRKPWPIIAGIALATVANHAAAAAIGVWCRGLLTPWLMDAAVGVSMVAMALWTLRPDRLEAEGVFHGRGAFTATVVAFFIAEIGDKTQIATLGLAAAYPATLGVVAGTTCGMLLANVPVVFLGDGCAARLPMKAIRTAAALLFLLLGCMLLWRAALHSSAIP